MYADRFYIVEHIHLQVLARGVICEMLGSSEVSSLRHMVLSSIHIDMLELPVLSY
jgi:hypothetical protein